MARTGFAIAAALVVCAAVVVSVSATPTNCQGSPNTNGYWSGEPKLLNTTKNGALYLAGDADENFVYVLHLYGTPYEKGFAQGTLMKDNILAMYDGFWVWIDEQVAKYVPFLPKEIREIIEKVGVEAALEYELLVTEKYTPSHFMEEATGMADAIGMKAKDVARFQLFPSLIKAACSMFGAWGEATQQSLNGGLLQLRALDWGVDNPFRHYPTVAVYHPEEGASQGNPFASLSFNGFLAMLTGYSTEIAVCEKVWIHYNGTDHRAGYPWAYMLREIAEFDSTIDAAFDRLNTADRTCSIFVGLGSRHDGQFRSVEYSLDQVELFDDTIYPGQPKNADEHPLFNDLVYIDKHSQPSSDPCMPSLLADAYGSLDVDATINLMGMFQTGDLHSAIADFDANMWYVGLASQSQEITNASDIIPAYDRQFIALNMTEIFALPAPTE